MNIVLNYAADTASAPAGFEAALQTAAGVLDAALITPITVTIAVNWQDLGGPLDDGANLDDLAYASAEWAGAPVSYSQLVTYLTAAAADPTFLADLPSDPTNGVGFRISTAEEKAFGLLPAADPNIDGEATFNSAFSWSYSNNAVPGAYDLVGVAEHELTHALGRLTLNGAATGMSLFTYSSATGQLDLNTADARYFSLDGGATNLANFDSSSDPADLAVGTADPFVTAFNSGQSYTWTPLDSEMMNALGLSGAPPVTAPAPAPALSVLDTTTGQPVSATAQPYTGPVSGLEQQYIAITSDSLNISVSTPGWFLHGSSGEDAIAANSGTNVLDGGTGSNFLTGGTGTDTFFVDDRGPTADIWSTVVGFHAGDAATIWGVTPQDFTLAWADGQGATGFIGLTLHATAPGQPTASLTLAGYTSADLSDGRLSVSFGTVGGSAYMYVQA